MSDDFQDIFLGNGGAYVRVASIAIAAYDYLLTLPAEYRFYKAQRSWWVSPGCMLFILIRYISIATLMISNVGYFGSFSERTCHHYFLAAPVFKVIQTMISQVILGIRTYNISKRSQRVLWTMLILFILITAMEWFTNLWDRSPAQNSAHNCTPGNSASHLSVWLYYVLAMSYDVVTIAISSYYLINWTATMGRMTSLVKLMLYDGLGYFVILTAANVFNLIIYRASDESIQSSGASVGYAVTWIMSQRILIHLRDAAAEQQLKQVVPRQIHSAADVSRAMRSQFEHSTNGKDPLDAEYNLKARHPTESAYDVRHQRARSDVELDVQVQIEHTVTVDYLPAALDRETYRSSRSSRWGRDRLSR